MRGLEQARYQARRSFKRRIAEKETQNPSIIAKVGNGAGTVVVSGRSGWIYIRLHGDDNQLTEAKLGIPLDTGSLDDAWVRVKRASPRKASYYAVQEFITSSTGDPAPPMSAHPLDPDAGPHTGSLSEDDVVFDDATGHDHAGSAGKGKKVTAADVINVAAGGIEATDVQAAINELDAAAFIGQIMLANRTGGQRTAGDVVVTDPGYDEAFIGTIAQGYPGKVLVVAEPITGNEFELSVSPSNHDDYGLSYPLTYIFNISPSLSSGVVYYRYAEDEAWTALPVKTPDDFFNGIDAVRFDYVNDKAYVSIAFSSASDLIYLKLTDSGDNPIECSYDSMAPYYDNRKAAVVLTGDDWTGNPAHQTVCDICHARSIWITLGIITFLGGVPPNWVVIQAELDGGHVEAASHSRTHPHTPYGDYVAEIDTSRAEIEANLNLPALYKKGSDEYVYAWLEPYGESDAAQRNQCGISKYLADRDISTDHVFATWDAANGLYNRIGYSIWMGSDGTTNVATLNASFDARYAAGEIYHLFFHPYNVDWTPGQYATQHLDHIKGKKDVWYVGFGALYLYHYAQERSIVTVVETATPALCWERGGPFDAKVIGTVSRNDGLCTSATMYRAQAAPSITGGGVFAVALAPNISGEGMVKAVFLDAIGEGGGGGGTTIEVQEDDAKVADASIVNFEGGGGKVVDEGGGKVTVDITPGGDGDGEEGHIHAYKEDKSAECDGVKVTFITAQQFEPYTLRVFHERLEQVDGMVDYAEGAMYDHFDMVAAPNPGDKLIVHYLAQRV